MNKNEDRTEYFADITPDETKELMNIEVEIASLDKTLETTMRFYTDSLSLLDKRKQALWYKIRERLRDKWPEVGDVTAKPDGKLYRKPEPAREDDNVV